MGKVKVQLFLITKTCLVSSTQKCRRFRCLHGFIQSLHLVLFLILMLLFCISSTPYGHKHNVLLNKLLAESLFRYSHLFSIKNATEIDGKQEKEIRGVVVWMRFK